MPQRTHDGLKKRCSINPATGKRCAKRDWPKCPHAWHFSFHYGNVEHRHSLDVVAKARGEHPPTTKADALKWRDRLRMEIRKGEPPALAVPAALLTVGDVADRYLAEFVGKRVTEAGVQWAGKLRPASALQADYALRLARACLVPAAHGRTVRFEERPVSAVTKADLEAIRAARRPHGVVGCNRLLARVRHLFNWAIAEGFADVNPFQRHGVSVVKLEMSAEAPRTRRLEPGEHERLLAEASPHLRALIVAALHTGCRVGELLSLQWHQIRHDEHGAPRVIELPAAKTKSGKARHLPVGPRLRAELAMRRHAPDGQLHGPEAYVFGDDVGGKVGSVKRAWEMTVLRANGHTPAYVKGKPGQLTPECREALRRINLHFHDLRRQFACTLLESGAAVHDVCGYLGHANITTTSRYLASSPERLARALAGIDPEPESDTQPDAIRTPFAHAPEALDADVENLVIC